MEIQFGKIINDPVTVSKSIFWYEENIKTLEENLKRSKMTLSLIFNSKYERVYLLNDESFIYIGIISKTYTRLEFDKASNRGYGVIAGYIQDGETISTSEVLICELNYNSFKGIHKSIFTEVSKNSGNTNRWIGYPDIVRNYPYISKYGRFTHQECLEHCKKIIPDYDFDKVMNDFLGVPMCVAVYKIEDVDGSVGYATYCFDNVDKAHEYARKGIKEHLIYCLTFVEGTYSYGLKNIKPSEMNVSDEFKRIFEKRTTLNGTHVMDIKDVFQYIKYCLVYINDNPKPNIKELEDYYENNGAYVEPNYGASYLSDNIFKRCMTGEYDNYDYFSYGDNKIKWKSEFLVYQITKSMYPAETVFQYRPLFLKTDKGQMSYDVFIFGLNIAIEYQGKQHFEPIDYFGGKDSFKDNVKRDLLKKELSEKHGIKLIYINYKETINSELIESKINEAISKS